MKKHEARTKSGLRFFHRVSVVATRTCSAVTTGHFSLKAASIAPRARMPALRRIPPELWWSAVMASSAKSSAFPPAMAVGDIGGHVVALEGLEVAPAHDA